MKRTLVLLLCILLSGVASAQCPFPQVIDSSGFYPSPNQLSCIRRGVPYYDMITWSNDSTQRFQNYSPWGMPMTVTLNRVLGAPSGITFVPSPSNTMRYGEWMCIAVSGTTNDPVGTYPLIFDLTVRIGAGSTNHMLLEHVYYLKVGNDSTCTSGVLPNYNLIFGKVYYDANLNGSEDSNDIPMSNVLVKINQGQIHAYTNSTGQYAVWVSEGNYDIAVSPPTYFYVNTVPAGYSLELNTTGIVSTDKDFGLASFPGIRDVRLDVTNGPARAGRKMRIWIDYKNAGTEPSVGDITLTLSPQLTYDFSSFAPASQAGNEVKWYYGALFPGEQRSFYVDAEVNPSTTVGTTVNATLTITNNGQDLVVANNTTTVTQPVTGSYDPNDIQVSPDDMKNGCLPETELVYRVRFQNTGNDTAFQVVVRDTLDMYLDHSTFSPIAASHPYAFQLEGNKYAVWTFDNILLPDSNVNEMESHGFLSYSIKVRENTPDETIIPNSASIYFDYNQPVKTNSVFSRVNLDPEDSTGTGIGTPEILSAIYPNPSSGKFHITLGKTLDNFNVEVTDISGKTVLSFKNLSGERVMLDMGTLEDGVYYYTITSQNIPVTRGKMMLLR